MIDTAETFTAVVSAPVPLALVGKVSDLRTTVSVVVVDKAILKWHSAGQCKVSK